MTSVSRRVLFQGAGAVGLAAAGWRPAEPSHLITDYRPSQPTGWPPQGHLRDGVGVTIGGHVTSVPFTIGHSRYEVSLVSFGAGTNPVYEAEPADPTVDFKRTLQKAWGEYYSFRYTGGFHGRTALSVQSYSVAVTRPSAHQVMFGCDLFLVYQPDRASADPPITADLRWIQVGNAGGPSTTEFAQRANPYYFPGGLTSVEGRPACSYYGGGAGGISTRPARAAAGFSERFLGESFLVADTRRKDAAGKGLIDILGGVKWGWQVKPAS
jgi:hypothetical protein